MYNPIKRITDNISPNFKSYLGIAIAMPALIAFLPIYHTLYGFVSLSEKIAERNQKSRLETEMIVEDTDYIN